MHLTLRGLMSGNDDADEEVDWSINPLGIVRLDPMPVCFVRLLLWLLFEDAGVASSVSSSAELPRAALSFLTIGFVNGISGNSSSDAMFKFTFSMLSIQSSKILFIGPIASS